MNNDTQPRQGTTAHMPDLNWSQVRETVLMLELAAVQIEAAMKDSNASVEVLTGSFTSMAAFMNNIAEAVSTLPDDGEIGATKARLQGNSEHVSGMVHQAIIAFQFYDKLVQRLAHVGHSLGELSDLVADGRGLFNPTREEIAMFEAVMQGVPVHEAVEKFMAEMQGKSDDIELF